MAQSSVTDGFSMRDGSFIKKRYIWGTGLSVAVAICKSQIRVAFGSIFQNGCSIVRYTAILWPEATVLLSCPQPGPLVHPQNQICYRMKDKLAEAYPELLSLLPLLVPYSKTPPLCYRYPFLIRIASSEHPLRGGVVGWFQLECAVIHSK